MVLRFSFHPGLAGVVGLSGSEASFVNGFSQRGARIPVPVGRQIVHTQAIDVRIEAAQAGFDDPGNIIAVETAPVCHLLEGQVRLPECFLSDDDSVDG